MSVYGVEAALQPTLPRWWSDIDAGGQSWKAIRPCGQQCEQLARQSGLSDDLRSVIAFLAQVSKTRKAIADREPIG